MKRKSNFVFYLFSSSTLLLASVGTERGPPTSVANVVARTGTGCHEKLVRWLRIYKDIALGVYLLSIPSN